MPAQSSLLVAQIAGLVFIKAITARRVAPNAIQVNRAWMAVHRAEIVVKACILWTANTKIVILVVWVCFSQWLPLQMNVLVVQPASISNLRAKQRVRAVLLVSTNRS